MDDKAEVIEAAEAVYEGLRSINHQTITAVHAAPDVYDVLGNLKGIGHMLPQACRQLSSSLTRSLDKFDVYEDDGADPAESIGIADHHLRIAARLAGLVGEHLAEAQAAIARQGYRE